MIPKIRNIMYATDLSKNSAYALAFAVDFARTHDAKIVILHAIEPFPAIVNIQGDREIEKQSYKKETERAEEGIKTHIDATCKKIEKQIGAPCTALVSKVLTPVGHPVEEILVNADAEECDIIVVGSHGKGFLKQTFLGSVSHAVLQRSRKPVFVVPVPSSIPGWD